MSDDFLDQARRNWRAQDAEIEAIGERVKRGRRWSDFMLWTELATGVFALAAAAFFFWMWLQEREAMLLIGAVVLVVFAPVLSWLGYKARRDEPRWADETPEGVLRAMIARTDTTLRVMRLVHGQGLMLLVLAAAVWIGVAVGWMQADALVRFSTAIWVGASLLTFAWAWWRSRAARRQRARCEALLAEYR